MKRLIGAGLILLLVAIGFFLWRQNGVTFSASQLAPGECLVYVEVPNLVQTAKRWPDTALYQILSEPAVQRFLRQPVSKSGTTYQKASNSFAALRCSALFFGVTEPDRDRWVCGLQTSVDQSTSRREITDVTKALFGQNIRELAPSSLEDQEIDLGGTGKAGASIYCTRIGSWTLLSRSTDLLLEVVRNSQTTSGGLKSVKLFQECRANIPIGYDVLSFVQGGPSLDPSAGLHWRFRKEETEGYDRAVLAATTIVGAQLRDTVFTLTGPLAKASPLDRKGLAMTSPSTVGYLATKTGFSEIWRLCGQLAEQSQLAETIRDYMGQVKSFGIEPRDLDSLVSGAELIIDRDPNADALKCAISLRVTDTARFQHLIDEVVSEKFSERTRRIEVESFSAYLMQVNEGVSIVFGLVGSRLLISGSEPNFAEFVRRLQTHPPGLEADYQFRAIAKLVDEPNDLFAYLDAKSGFERFYGASRPMLVFGILLMPALSRFVDAMALPDASDVSKHLSPIVLSRHRVSNGVVDESIGPITAYDAAALLLGGALAMGVWDH